SAMAEGSLLARWGGRSRLECHPHAAERARVACARSIDIPFHEGPTPSVTAGRPQIASCQDAVRADAGAGLTTARPPAAREAREAPRPAPSRVLGSPGRRRLRVKVEPRCATREPDSWPT